MQSTIPSPGRREWLAIFGGVLGAFMAILDIQITNASLKDIQGALSATLEEGSWISTSYLVAEIIIIPMTGWLISIYSMRRFVIITSVLFTLFSLLCSLAWNLESMIVFRILQGLTGGALIPVAFTLIMTKLPMEQRPKGMALFSITAVTAPAIGPALGGWLTETFSWHYVFYINLVPGLLMTVLFAYGLDKSPPNWQRFKQGDWWGILTMMLGLGALQIMLEEGQREDWFESELIVRLAIVSVVALIAFVVIELKNKHPLVNLRLLGQRNFAAATAANLLLGLGLFGSVYILPLYLASIQQYNALQIGTVIMWMGIPQLLLIPLMPTLMKHVAPHYLVGSGFFLFGLSSIMSGQLSIDFAGDQFILPQIVRALGQPLIMVPLSVIATQGIAPQDAPSASSLFNIVRNLGGAIGIALLATLVDHRTQLHAWHLKEQLITGSQSTTQGLVQLEQTLIWQGVDPALAAEQALLLTAQLIQREAAIMAYSDAFMVIGAGLFVAMLILTALLKRPGANSLKMTKPHNNTGQSSVIKQAA